MYIENVYILYSAPVRVYFLVSQSKPSFRGFGTQNPLDFSSRGHQGNLPKYLYISMSVTEEEK
jgi:hypothetical protein